MTVLGKGAQRADVARLQDLLVSLEGNRSPRVQGFSYVFSRMDKLLGFGHVP